MGRELIDSCDNQGCRSKRGETNHWFVILSQDLPLFLSCKSLDPLGDLNSSTSRRPGMALFLALGNARATEIFSKQLSKGL